VKDTSLIIPSYERADLLRQSLARLRFLPTQPDEVLVVDDGSRDGTRGVCDTYGATHIYIDRRGDANSALARNRGLHAATGEVVIVTDPEVMFDTDVIGQLRDTGDDVLSPAVGRKQAGPGGIFHSAEGWFYVSAFRREWAVEVGGWDESFPEPWGWEDIDFWERLEATGHPRRYIAGCEVSHLWHPTRNDTGSPLNEAHIERSKRLRAESTGGIIVNGVMAAKSDA
jgi:glycosyltransferase involved in cell wall biosynthesis